VVGFEFVKILGVILSMVLFMHFLMKFDEQTPDQVYFNLQLTIRVAA